MANETMTLIATATIGTGGAGGFTFNSIPQSFTDLYLVMSIRTGSTAANWDGIYLQINGDTNGANYTARILSGNGSSASSFVDGGGRGGYATSSLVTSNTFNNASVYIPNYTGSTNKSISSDSVGENNGTTTLATLGAGIWTSTAAITSILVAAVSGTNLAQYSSGSLYGVLKGSGGATVS